MSSAKLCPYVVLDSCSTSYPPKLNFRWVDVRSPIKSYMVHRETSGPSTLKRVTPLGSCGPTDYTTDEAPRGPTNHSLWSERLWFVLTLRSLSSRPTPNFGDVKKKD